MFKKIFLKWKPPVERFSGKQLKVLRSDNGGKYAYFEFKDYLTS